MNETPKVTAILNKPYKVIDGKTGEAKTVRTGRFKGFGPQMTKAIKEGYATVETEVMTGKFPVGHKHGGKWAAQVTFSTFESKELADAFADQVTPVLKRLLGVIGETDDPA